MDARLTFGYTKIVSLVVAKPSLLELLALVFTLCGYARERGERVLHVLEGPFSVV